MTVHVRSTFVCRWAVSIIILPLVSATARAQVDYVKDVRPILEQHCYQCHGPEKQKSAYRLDRRDIAFKGGEFGEPAIVPSQPSESPLLKYVRGEIEGLSMPPKDSGVPALNEQQLATLQSWIEQGAVWPDEHSGVPVDSGPHWSLAPLTKPKVPNVEPWLTEKSTLMNSIDAFVLAKLREKNLNPSKPADRRTLIRRVTFDLIGLPPTPEEIDGFVNDTSPDAWQKLVDRLLASPHYGERWGRHWLDVVRYTESNGFEYDRIRDNAWHYRDYVIKSFNSDKPYDQFMKEQVAGDVLSPVTSDGIIATSLLVCGPYDQAGNAQQNQTQRMITREDELEDVVGVVAQTFLGLTVNCARCHSHKFDPIPQTEYYQIKSVFEGVKHGERDIATPGEIQQHQEHRKALEEQLALVSKAIAEIDAEGAKIVAATRSIGDLKPGPAPFAGWSFGSASVEGSELSGELVGGATISEGRLVLPKDGAYLKSEPLTKDIREKTLEAWVQLSTLDQGGGAVISLQSNSGQIFDAIVFGERQVRKWMAGSEGFARTKDLDVPEEADAVNSLIHVAMVYRADNSIQFYRNGLPLGAAYTPGSGLQTFKAGEAHVVLGLRHSGGGRPWLTGSLQRAAVYDRALSDAEVLQSFEASGFSIPHSEILAALTPDQQSHRDDLEQRRKQVKVELDALPKDGAKSYVGVRVQPQPTRRLKRGDVLSPDEVVTPGALSAVSTVNPDFGLPADAPESERRVRFANWLADPANPLPARVISNRVWQFHFGQGLVTTANDFGVSGTKPSHPELLDWLASTLIENKWSLKHLHRVIVNSATYQLSSEFDAAKAAVDADNQWLWRYAPRRLEGEAIRDAILVASGRLDRTMGGPGFRSFIMTEFNGTSYTPTDGPQFDRRTVYRMNVNSGKDPLLDSFDCPDPSIKTPRRGVTTTPLQALELMNNAFVVRQASHLAERVLAEAQGDDRTAIRLAWQHTLGRQPTDEELTRAVTALKSRGLKNVCWVLLNSTEFVYLR